MWKRWTGRDLVVPVQAVDMEYNKYTGRRWDGFASERVNPTVTCLVDRDYFASTPTKGRTAVKCGFHVSPCTPPANHYYSYSRSPIVNTDEGRLNTVKPLNPSNVMGHLLLILLTTIVRLCTLNVMATWSINLKHSSMSGTLSKNCPLSMRLPLLLPQTQTVLPAFNSEISPRDLRLPWDGYWSHLVAWMPHLSSRSLFRLSHPALTHLAFAPPVLPRSKTLDMNHNLVRLLDAKPKLRAMLNWQAPSPSFHFCSQPKPTAACLQLEIFSLPATAIVRVLKWRTSACKVHLVHPILFGLSPISLQLSRPLSQRQPPS